MAKRIDAQYDFRPPKKEDVREFLAPDETIKHTLVPKKGAFILNHIFGMIFIVLLWLGIDTAVIVMLVKFDVFKEMLWMLAIIIPFFLVHLMPVWMWIANIVNAFRNHKKYETVFTNTRIIMKRPQKRNRNVIFHFVNYQDIQTMYARSGIIDRMFKVGDISFQAGIGRYVIEDVPKHKEMLDVLQKAVANGRLEASANEDPFASIWDR